MNAAAQPRARRARLGAEMRRQRQLAGKSGREMSRLTGISHAGVSRIETGQSVPSLPQVQAWCVALGLDEATHQRLSGMVADALGEIDSLREVAAAGLTPLQEDVRELEATTRVMRHFQCSHVPGLLQTRDYARHVLELALAVPAEDVDQAVGVRMDRQSILADPGRRFEFVLTEGALRWRPTGAARELVPGQLDHIAGLSRLPAIKVGVIPLDAPMHALPISPFIIYDEREDGGQPFVTIELAHAALYPAADEDVKAYRSRLAELRKSALFGDAGREALARIAGALRQG